MRITSPLAAASVLSLGLFAGAWAKAPPRKPANAVQREMRLLEAAMRDSVTAIAAGDVRSLPARLHAVHLASGDTEAALKSGAYKLPREGADVAAFVALDQAFHEQMIEMVKAAATNDVPTTAARFGDLMNRCQGCHAQFRARPSP